MKILTDIKEPRISVEWQQKTEFRLDILGGGGILSDLIAALRLLRLRKDYDILILAGSRKTNLFTIFAGMTRKKKPPVLYVDCLWYKPKKWLVLSLKKLQFWLMARGVDRFVVWASHEVHDYAEAFSMPKDKFLYIPHHHSLEGYEYTVSEGDYIFSGGDGDRDYPTLLKAIEGISVKVLIATRQNDWLGKLAPPEGVQIVPTDPGDFRKLMAGSKMVVIPMEKGLLHSGGQQTYINAMAMGKPVIVADDKGAKDYIEHGVNGLIVPAGDSQGLGSAIRSLMEDTGLARRLAHHAKEAKEIFSTQRCLARILNTAEELAN